MSSLTVTVAFAGDCPAAQVTNPFAAAIDLVRDAVGALAAAPTGLAGETVLDAYAALGLGGGQGPRLRLLTDYTGEKEGVFAAWRHGANGPVHLVFPHIDERAAGDPGAAWTDAPASRRPGTRIDLGSIGLRPGDGVTVLDGEAALAEDPPRPPRLEQTRFLIRWADLLVAAWDGRAASEPGGTDEAVLLALGKGIPVVWCAADDGLVRLIDPGRLWPGTTLSELVALVSTREGRDRITPPAQAGRIAELLLRQLAPPGAADRADEDPETEARRAFPPPGAPGAPEIRMARAWRRIAALLAGEPAAPAPEAPDGDAAPGPPPATARQRGLGILAAEAQRADRLATHHGNLQRTVQTLLFALAVLAVLVGTLPAALPASLKVALVLVEFLIVCGIYGLWSRQVTASHHRRWSDLRRYAERLRAMRATWPHGIDVADGRAGPPGTWTEWRARAVLRFVGPPTGVLDAARLIEDARLARDEADGIILGQALYHARAERLNHAIAHRLEVLEGATFKVLLACLAGFLAAKILLPLVVPGFALPGLFGDALLVMSAVVPAIAAACLGLEAKVGFEELARRSRRFGPEFERLRQDLAEPLGPSRAAEGLREAARLLTTDADGWRDGLLRRRLAKL
ncbi:MAG TPA: hypothetical protein VEA41_12840 [Salinarimonas sp.]|nr:hypothetical protein [Salinarimonas sp.]